MDVGDQDGLRTDAGKLHDVFDTYGLANTFEIYPGTHTSKVADRFQNHVLPFFSRTLCDERLPIDHVRPITAAVAPSPNHDSRSAAIGSHPRGGFLLVVTGVAAFSRRGDVVGLKAPPPASPLSLWYRQPATDKPLTTPVPAARRTRNGCAPCRSATDASARWSSAVSCTSGCS